MEDAYTWYKKLIDSEKSNLTIPKEASQAMLILKGAGSELLEKQDPSKYFTFTHNGKFGFSEQMVNMLMQIAYEKGSKDIEQKSFTTGFNTAQTELTNKILSVLDITECDNCRRDY